jgi:hypothetical protein
MIVAKHGLVLKGGFSFVDGLNLAVEKPSGEALQNATYNQWLHANVISTVLAFAPMNELKL